MLFGLVAAVGWGLADYYAAKASKRFGGLACAVMMTVVGAMTFDLVYGLFFRSHSNFELEGVLYAAASGLAFTVANLTFYKGLEYGPVSIVSPLGSLYPLVTALFLAMLFGSRLGIQQGVGIFIVMCGVLAASGLFERVKHGRRMGGGPLLGLAAAFFWGIAWGLIARAVTQIGWQLTAAIELSCSALSFLPLLPLLSRAERGVVKNLLPSLKSKMLIAAGVLTISAFLVLSIGMERFPDLATTAVVISACYPVLTVFLALRRLGERIDPVPFVGALIAIVGIVVLLLG